MARQARECTDRATAGGKLSLFALPGGRAQAAGEAMARALLPDGLYVIPAAPISNLWSLAVPGLIYLTRLNFWTNTLLTPYHSTAALPQLASGLRVGNIC
jgi:hypothetical protein